MIQLYDTEKVRAWLFIVIVAAAGAVSAAVGFAHGMAEARKRSEAEQGPTPMFEHELPCHLEHREMLLECLVATTPANPTPEANDAVMSLCLEVAGIPYQ